MDKEDGRPDPYYIPRISSGLCLNCNYFNKDLHLETRTGPSVSTWEIPCLAASRHHGLWVGKCAPRHSRDGVPRYQESFQRSRGRLNGVPPWLARDVLPLLARPEHRH